MQLSHKILFGSSIIICGILIKIIDISYFMPRILLYTGFRNSTKYYWDKIIKIDEKIKYSHTHIPIIEEEDYSFERLRIASNNFLAPVLVRGLFKDTIAMKKWKEDDYLPALFKDIILPIIPNAKVGNAQNNRYYDLFSNAFKDIVTNQSSTKFMFFPSFSTANINDSDTENYNNLRKLTNEIVKKDLELERILWNGFGTKTHKTYYGSQIIIGRGSDETEETTGTGWHSEGGNNWFVQVVGRKKWYFLNPKYSGFFKPLRFGVLTFNTGEKNISKYHDNLPLEYADLEAGDLLYNPDLYWHTTKNYDGLTISIPVREANVTYLIKSNLHLASVIFVNLFFQKIGINIGGYEGV
jgi:hypothetical protein